MTRPDARTRASSLRRTRRWRVLPHLEGYLYVLPAFLILGLFHLWPSIYTFFLSLHNWNFIRRNPTFIGLTNYERLWADEYFWLALKNTAVYALGVVPPSIVIGLCLALLLTDGGRLSVMYRVLLFTPVVTAASGGLGHLDMDVRSGSGQLLQPLARRGGPRSCPVAARSRFGHAQRHPPGRLEEHRVQRRDLLCGLRNISHEYREAARIDGASPWQELTRIVLPLLAPTTYFVLIVSCIGSFQVFSQVYVMTGGGPLNRTLVLVYYLYDRAFGSFRIGYAAAIAFVLFGIMLTLTLLQRALLQHRIHYDR